MSCYFGSGGGGGGGGGGCVDVWHTKDISFERFVARRREENVNKIREIFMVLLLLLLLLLLFCCFVVVVLGRCPCCFVSIFSER